MVFKNKNNILLPSSKHFINFGVSLGVFFSVFILAYLQISPDLYFTEILINNELIQKINQFLQDLSLIQQPFLQNAVKPIDFTNILNISDREIKNICFFQDSETLNKILNSHIEYMRSVSNKFWLQSKVTNTK